MRVGVNMAGLGHVIRTSPFGPTETKETPAAGFLAAHQRQAGVGMCAASGPR